MRRALLVFAIAAYFIGAVAWLALDRRVSRQAFTELSSANTADEGVSLAYKYLASSGREVSQLTRPVDANAIPRDAVIFRFVELGSPLSFRDDIPDIDDDDPNLTDKSKKKKPLPPKKRPPATALLSDDEEEWVRRGGRFVLGTADSYGPLKVRGLTIKTARKAFPIWSGLDELALPDPRGLDGDPLRRAHALYVAGNDIVIARQTIGAGELILIATPELFTNKHIGRGNHLALLAALAGAERPVFFDELPHGLGGDAGFVAMLKEWNLGPFLLLLLMLAAVIFWRGGRAIGAREDDYRETRSDAVDLVASLGALYDRSMTPAEALAQYHYELTRAVAASSGLRGDALHKRVADLTGGIDAPHRHDKVTPENFQRILQTLNDSFRRIEHAKHS
ncbi:MAG TPA: DUF4350 domain-containing protein [Thermoanaerobaculia bacterium]|nr:DUF4350 domain-containing protein [Thermoanaerobaculia bacterium]